MAFLMATFGDVAHQNILSSPNVLLQRSSGGTINCPRMTSMSPALSRWIREGSVHQQASQGPRHYGHYFEIAGSWLFIIQWPPVVPSFYVQLFPKNVS